MTVFRRRRLMAIMTAVVCAVLGATTATTASAAIGPARPELPNWTAGWGASPVIGSDIPGSTCPAGTGLTNQTVRNVIFLSTGGNHVRIRLTNVFGTAPMSISHASVAIQASGAVAVLGTVRELTFHGRHAVTLAAGGREFSDPVALTV
ncbi:MAG TPA: SGNH/GDSL hydrolase family protein, partial [Pseudonocardiaceae bacterium]